MKTLTQLITENKAFNVYLMVGIPGAGKSTWCKENKPNLEIVSRDIIRAELGFTANADEKAVLSAKQEQKVTDKEYARIDALCKSRTSFIIDDTNTGKYRKKLIDKLHSLGAKVIGVNIDTPLNVCIERRKGQIPADVMQSLYNKKIDLTAEEVDDIITVKSK